MASKMNVAWSWHRPKEVLTTNKATQAESRLNAIKKAAKTLKKGVEDSLKTSTKNRGDDIESRKRRTSEYVLGENVCMALNTLNTEPIGMNLSAHTTSPLTSVLERFANLEKTIGHMLAVNECELYTFIGSDTPLAKLLSDDIPAVANAKKEIDLLMRKQDSSQTALEKERKKLEKMQLSAEEDVDADALQVQQEKKDRLSYELENLNKEVSMEQDKLTSTLLTLVSRENRYAQSVLELMKLKKQFYENAFRTIEAELPQIERMLEVTIMRPVFGERLEDHLRATGRTIAFPIALSIRNMLDGGLNDEGLFRISPKQIKLEKMKAHIDSHQPLEELLSDSDAHLHSALLKSYLRELPISLLGDDQAYARWIRASTVKNSEERLTEFASILSQNLSSEARKNVQYVIRFLSELSTKCETTKMTLRNIAIVLAPTLLRATSDKGPQLEHSENIIGVLDTLIKCYGRLFPTDIDLYLDDEDLGAMRLGAGDSSPSATVPLRHRFRRSRSKSPSLPNVPATTSAVASAVAGAAAASAMKYEPPPPPVLTSSTAPHSLSVESPSPKHKRKPSVRTVKNFMDKIKVQAGGGSGGGASSRGSSADGAHIQADPNSV
jgi:hypothetical protein